MDYKDKEYLRSELGLSATGIGSVPHREVKGVCDTILKLFPKMPFWPQFPKRSPYEDMNVQFSEGLPMIYFDMEERRLIFKRHSKEDELLRFWERFLAEDLSSFLISFEYAPGLYYVVEEIKKEPDRYGPFIKGQMVGPITFMAGVMGEDGKTILFDQELREAITKAMALKGLWQVRKLKETGKRIILFLDEPYLSGFGSAFVAISRDEVIDILSDIIGYIKEKEKVLVGVHCCGNTDWAMLMQTQVDIISFDAYSYLDHFLLYKNDISNFLERGGYIAWGIVPTDKFSKDITVFQLKKQLLEAWNRICDGNIGRIIQSSILTPSCGLGTMKEPDAILAMEILNSLPEEFLHMDLD